LADENSHPFHRVIGEFCDKRVVTRGTKKKNTVKKQVLEIDRAVGGEEGERQKREPV